MEHKPTAEQEACIDFVLNDERNLMIEARAGATKTTTLVMIANAIQPQPAISLAFNASIKKEMAQRLPKFVECKTLNGLGHSVWGNFLRKRLTLDKRKTQDYLGKLIASELDPKDAEDFYNDEYTELLDMVRAAKYAGYIPEGVGGYWKPLSTWNELEETLEYIPSETQRHFLDKIMVRSLKEAQSGIIDFDDQVMLPCVAPVTFPFYKIVFVDEAQDLAPINHMMLKKLVKKNRLIAVGDPYQAIYGFRGADTRSMFNMAHMFDMETRYLTVNFRSGSSILDAVKWRTPDIKARPNAPAGLVQSAISWNAETIPDQTTIICRNNAPLFVLAIRLLKAGKYPEIVGRDVVANIAKIMKKLGKPGVASTQAIEELDQWKKKEEAKRKSKGFLNDQVACIRVFLDRYDTLGEATRAMIELGESAGRIKLMTGHKSKGLEFDEVFWLEPELINKEQEQDLNLAYVIGTRARNVLTKLARDNYDE